MFKELTPAEKRAKTIRERTGEQDKKKKEAVAKRAATIEAKKRAAEKKTAKKAWRKKFMEFTSKPIVWVFALIGWGCTVYIFIKFVILVLLRVFGVL